MERNHEAPQFAQEVQNAVDTASILAAKECSSSILTKFFLACINMIFATMQCLLSFTNHGEI